MNVFKTSIVIMMMLVIALAFVQGVKTQATDDLQTFFSNKYIGISIRVDATEETVPGENITIKLWFNITTDQDFKMEYLNLSVYGFKNGAEKTPLLSSLCVIENISLPFNYTTQYNFTVPVPTDVWDAAYAGLQLKYFIQDVAFDYSPSFSITIVRNVYYEQLQAYFNLLNQTFGESFQMNLTAENLASLNRTYWELLQNYTALQASANELDNTRRVAVILGVTTVFFVATTIFMLMRKPKEPW
jgi:hypothetical protein